MKKNLLAILVLSLLALPAVAMATPPRPGPYVSGFIGVTVPETVDATSFGSGGSIINDRIKFDPGLNVGGTLGYDFGMMRLEGEISYKDLQLNRVAESGGPIYRIADGNVDTTAFMANVFFDMHNNTPVTPYVGGGIGFASLHMNDVISRDGTFLYGSDDQVAFAYQAGAGLEIALNRQLSLDLAYRYFGTSQVSFIDTEFDVKTHNATVGLRLKF